MTRFIDTLPCSAGGTHEWGMRAADRHLEQFCTKCETGWSGINQQMRDLLPTEEGLYQGRTYLWEFDGEEWTPLRAPREMSGPHWDMPMTQVRLVAGSK